MPLKQASCMLVFNAIYVHGIFSYAAKCCNCSIFDDRIVKGHVNMTTHGVTHALAAPGLSCHVSNCNFITLIHRYCIAPMLFDPRGGNGKVWPSSCSVRVLCGAVLHTLWPCCMMASSWACMSGACASPTMLKTLKGTQWILTGP